MSPAAPSFGLKVPNCGGVLCPVAWAEPHTIDALTGDAERFGFSSVWLHDHLLTPGELRHLGSPAFHEPLVTAAYLAASHPRLTIGTAAIVLPLRDPLVVAKQASTLNAFAPGRFILGLGAGRYESEFVAAGLGEAFAERGARAAEYLEIVRALLNDEGVTFAGRFRSLRDASMHPKPFPGSLPIWYAGNADIGVRRAALLADGWIGAAIEPADTAKSVRRIERLRGDAGLDAPFAIALSVTVERRDERRRVGTDVAHLHAHPSSIAGDAPAIIARLREYLEAGVTHFLVSLRAAELDQMREEVAWFASEVMAGIGVEADQAAAL